MHNHPGRCGRRAMWAPGSRFIALARQVDEPGPLSLWGRLAPTFERSLHRLSRRAMVLTPFPSPPRGENGEWLWSRGGSTSSPRFDPDTSPTARTPAAPSLVLAVADVIGLVRVSRSIRLRARREPSPRRRRRPCARRVRAPRAAPSSPLPTSPPYEGRTRGSSEHRLAT
jgi:hypothetical protein